ncbi:hypothetical protein [Nocardioides astragali]|uniref:AttH domain-containing protein n=1 Tax=Nocardioides astragali TaxID=1776736 RepID=A0ABW2N569_9ACTN|nr:hypothetical protein [Nocardioides astragali]
MPILTAADLTQDLEGTYYSPKMQWWCAHADLVDDDGNDTSLYFWPALGSLDEAWICSLHTKDEMIDLTTLYQPLGTFKTSRSGVDVQFGNQYIRGTYPNYEIYVEGEKDGEHVSLLVKMTAETPAFEALPNLRGITWHYVPRFAVEGALTRGGESKQVKGAGYLERRRGRFWTPGIERGLWESIPGAGASPFSIPLFYKVWKNDGTIQLQTLTFTVDGKTMVDFEDVEVDILETAKLPGFEDIDHPMRYRLTANGDGGSAEIEVVRNPNRLGLRDYFDDPDPRAKWTGIYGAGHAEGVVTYQGTEHRVSAPTYGSALFFSEK